MSRSPAAVALGSLSEPRTLPAFADRAASSTTPRCRTSHLPVRRPLSRPWREPPPMPGAAWRI